MGDLNRLTSTRRELLTGAAAGLACAALPGVASAKAPMANTQAPGFYRFKFGSFEATVVSDGPLHMGEPSDGVFSDLSKEQMVKELTDNFLPTDNVLLEQNALVINTGDRVVLFDTGLDAKDVDAIVLTHTHPDHCWALMADDGSRNFPNAQIYVTQADLDFWTDEGKLTHPLLKDFIAGTRKHLLPNRDRMVFVRDGQELLPGIQAIAAPGHTVGHTVYMITSQGKSLCNLGDTTHHHILSVESPRREFAYDTDGKQAVASRLRMLDMLASSRIPAVTYHLPWPGLGHFGKQGDGFRYFPAPMRTML